MLKVVLAGYGTIAESLLLGLLKSKHEIIGVLNWEKERPSRFKAFLRETFTPDNLTSIIKANNLYEVKAANTNDKRFAKEMKKLKPDVILVGSWGEILKKETLELPKIACINCHPSLLPKHRGSNPYISSIMTGETKTGITFHLMDEKIDTGEILLQKEVDIAPNDKGTDVKRKCAFAAKDSVSELLDKLENAELIPQKQIESEASYYPRLNSYDGKIFWLMPAQAIHNHIRALNPWMKCHTFHKKVFIFINSAKMLKLNAPVETPGRILGKANNKLLIATGTPDTAILAEDIEAYGPLSKLWSKKYLEKVIKIGDYLQ